MPISSPVDRGSRRGRSDRCIVSAKLFCCWYSRALSIASAAWPAIESAVSTTSPRSGRAGSSETSVSVASDSGRGGDRDDHRSRAPFQEGHKQLLPH